MKMRAGFLATCAASALAISLGFAAPVLAADTMPVKAAAAAEPFWWYEGFAEIGGRAYLNNPDKTKLGKFYEYRDLSPGVFGDFYFAAHRTNPIDIAIWGENVGKEDQAFGFDYAKPGAYYLTLGWDQTPHVFGKDSATTFSPIGGNILSTPPYPFPPTGPTMPAFNTFDLKYRRDTASAAARWTPTDNWDITADYSHMHREGTQRLSAVTFSAAAANAARSSIELPKPVDDTTQNGNIKGEYAGSTPWGKPFNLALGGGVSVYNNQVGCDPVGTQGGFTFRPSGSPDANCLSFQNPWNTPAGNTATFPAWNRYSLAPDNQAQSMSLSGGVGLPLNSRYMGTLQYTRMTQDETFMASTINPAAALTVMPRSSLGGDARTTLSNNVLNTQILSNLHSTLRYRYYDYHSNQQPVVFATGAIFENPDTNSTPLPAPGKTAQPVNFTKQNASGELVWQPMKWLNTGAAYEWERNLRKTNGVDVVTLQTGVFDAVTNENAGKVFADAKLWGWSILRASLRYGERKFDGDYTRIANNNNAFRNVDVQDRKSTIANASWAIDVTNTVSITPVGGYRFDDYPANGVTTIGINNYRSWNAGGDIAWNINPRASVYVTYIYDNAHRNVYQRTAPSDVVLDTIDFTNTVIVGAKWSAIPDKLFLNANYTFTRSTSKWSSNCGPGGCNAAVFTTSPAIFPDSHNTNHRVDLQAKYMLDPMSFGLLAKAQPYVKARVIWEKNQNDSWQNIDQQLGWAVGPDNALAHSVFLGITDPNYNVVVGQIAFGLKW